jgi:hypothetical protein
LEKKIFLIDAKPFAQKKRKKTVRCKNSHSLAPT